MSIQQLWQRTFDHAVLAMFFFVVGSQAVWMLTEKGVGYRKFLFSGVFFCYCRVFSNLQACHDFYYLGRVAHNQGANLSMITAANMAFWFLYHRWDFRRTFRASETKTILKTEEILDGHTLNNLNHFEAKQVTEHSASLREKQGRILGRAK